MWNYFKIALIWYRGIAFWHHGLHVCDEAIFWYECNVKLSLFWNLFAIVIKIRKMPETPECMPCTLLSGFICWIRTFFFCRCVTFSRMCPALRPSSTPSNGSTTASPAIYHRYSKRCEFKCLSIMKKKIYRRYSKRCEFKYLSIVKKKMKKSDFLSKHFRHLPDFCKFSF